MNIFLILSSILALSLYIPLCKKILSGKVKQNFATWCLWASLDAVIAGTLIVQNGNFALAVAYTFGSSITTLCILKSKSYSWTRFESFIVFLVLLSLGVWFIYGSVIATIASSIAMLFAGIPQLINTAKNPKNTPTSIYLGFTIANLLSVYGAKNWSIEERFYPASATLFCAIITILSLGKFFWKKQKTLFSYVKDVHMREGVIMLAKNKGITPEAYMAIVIKEALDDGALERFAKSIQAQQNWRKAQEERPRFDE